MLVALWKLFFFSSWSMTLRSSYLLSVLHFLFSFFSFSKLRHPLRGTAWHCARTTDRRNCWTNFGKYHHTVTYASHSPHCYLHIATKEEWCGGKTTKRKTKQILLFAQIYLSPVFTPGLRDTIWLAQPYISITIRYIRTKSMSNPEKTMFSNHASTSKSSSKSSSEF